jgi:hypothetical protein
MSEPSHNKITLTFSTQDFAKPELKQLTATEVLWRAIDACSLAVYNEEIKPEVPTEQPVPISINWDGQWVEVAKAEITPEKKWFDETAITKRSDEIDLVIEDESIEWSWDHPTKGKQQEFDHELALSLLLNNGIVFLASIQGTIRISVLCSDTFYWGVADAEDLPYDQLPVLYRMWRADPKWGVTRWCIIRRGEPPQPRLKQMMVEAGVWDAELETAIQPKPEFP